MVKVDAVVLAGGDGEILDPAVHIKGLVPVAGKPMVEWVVDALRASETIGDIAVVLPTAENLGPWADKVDKLVVSSGPVSENMVAGVGAFRNDRFVVSVTGDVPALTPEAVDDFVSVSLAAKADFSYPLIRKEDMLAQFPGSVRTFVKIKGGQVTGGNLMVASPELVLRVKEVGQRFFDVRKSPLRMARLVGAPFIFKMAVGILDPSDVEEKLSELFGGKCVAIYTTHASIGADVDKPVDVIVSERVLFERDSGRIVTGKAK